MFSSAAYAQASGNAERLFQEAKKEMLAGNYELACGYLQESYELERAGGTLQNWALCLEKSGKHASAYARWSDLKSLSSKSDPPRTDRIELADEHIATLMPKLSRVFVEMPKENKVDGLSVTIAKVKFGESTWKLGILLDPGEHVLEVTAPDRKPFTTTLKVAEHTTLRVKVPVLAEQLRPQVFDERQRAARTLRTAGLVTAGAGLAVAAVGGVFGALAWSNSDTAKERCPALECSSYGSANNLRADARTFANVSNVLLPVGVLAVGTGVVLVWQGFKRAPKKQEALRLTPTLGGLLAEGEF